MKEPILSALPLQITKLTGFHIGNGTYTINIKVNSGIPVTNPPPVYNFATKEIDWNLQGLKAGEEANGLVVVNFSKYEDDEIAKIFIKDENAVRQDKGGVVIKQTDFPPFLPPENKPESEAEWLEEFSLTQQGSNFRLQLSFDQIGTVKYKEESGIVGPLTRLLNFLTHQALEIRLMPDNNPTGNLNIDFEIPGATIGVPIATILTLAPLDETKVYLKWGRFYINV